MDNMNNLICDSNSVKPNYPIDMNTRYLDIYCFGDKEIVFHGYYDFNYSFALFKIVWNQGLKFEDLIWRILFGEWPCLAQKYDFYKLLGYDNIEDTYASIRLNYMYKDQVIEQYIQNSMFTDFVRLDKENIGLIISNQVNSIYTINYVFDEKTIEQKLNNYKETITMSNIIDYKTIIAKVEKELSAIQYVVFGSEHIQDLYKECRQLCWIKYNEYMNGCR